MESGYLVGILPILIDTTQQCIRWVPMGEELFGFKRVRELSTKPAQEPSPMAANNWVKRTQPLLAWR